jgi:hypothetical protein
LRSILRSKARLYLQPRSPAGEREALRQRAGARCEHCHLFLHSSHQPAPLLSVRVGGRLYPPHRAAWDPQAKRLTLRSPGSSWATPSAAPAKTALIGSRRPPSRCGSIRTFYVRGFLTSQFKPKTQALDLKKITPEVLLDHVLGQSRRLSLATVQILATSLRSFCRFLCLSGRSQWDLSPAIPRIGSSATDKLPNYLSRLCRAPNYADRNGARPMFCRIFFAVRGIALTDPVQAHRNPRSRYSEGAANGQWRNGGGP